MHELLDRRGRGLVHHFQAGGDDAGGDDLRHRVAGAHHVVEGGKHALRELRLGHQLDGDLGEHHQHALGAGDQRQEVIAGRIERAGADLDDLAVDRHTAHAQQVVHRQAVLEAMHAAGVLGDVAADRARDLRGRVRRVIEAVGCRHLGDREVAHAWLHHRRARQRIELEDAVEARQRQQHAASVRQRAARQSGTRAARHHRHAQLEAGAQHRHHLLLGRRQRHHQRQRAVGGQAVALVGAQILGLVHQRARGQHAAERLDHPHLVDLGKIALGLPERQHFGLCVHDCRSSPWAPAGVLARRVAEAKV